MPFTVAQIVTMAQQLDASHQLQIIEQLQKSVEQKPLNDLSKLTAHPNYVNGNSDDLVNLNWEKELNLDFPR